MEVMNIVWIVVIVLAVIHGLKGAFGGGASAQKHNAAPATVSKPRVAPDEDEESGEPDWVRRNREEADPSRAGSAAYNAQEALDRMGH